MIVFVAVVTQPECLFSQAHNLGHIPHALGNAIHRSFGVVLPRV